VIVILSEAKDLSVHVLGLLPIVPILLLPFAAAFFIIVFPLWIVGLAVLGLVLVISRALDWVATKAGITAFAPIARAVHYAFRWVLTFGGFAGRVAPGADESHS
jgi:hypothetical protein